MLDTTHSFTPKPADRLKASRLYNADDHKRGCQWKLLLVMVTLTGEVTFVRGDWGGTPDVKVVRKAGSSSCFPQAPAITDKGDASVCLVYPGLPVGFAGVPHFYRDFKANEGWIRGVDGRLELSEEQVAFGKALGPFRSLNERVHGRLKSKFAALVRWSCDRQIDVLDAPEPSEIVLAWTVCSLLHNIELQQQPVVSEFCGASCDASLWGWPLYDVRLPLPE